MSEHKIKLWPIGAREWADLTSNDLSDYKLQPISIGGTINDHCNLRIINEIDVILGTSLEQVVQHKIICESPENTCAIVNYLSNIKIIALNVYNHGYELPIHNHETAIYSASGIALIHK